MRTVHPHLRPAAALFAMAFGALSVQAQTPAAPAQGQAPAASAGTEEAVQLPEFSVSANKADAYRPADVMSVSRVAGSILDSPFSVNVVSRELMNDLGTNATYDVNRYFAGLSAGRGAGMGGIMDRQNFRGFESFSKTVDNFSSFDYPSSNGYQANFDPAMIERQELVMGPDSILSPTGTPGGSVNIITKSPSFNASTDFTGVVGNYNANKWTLDTTGPISQHLAYRAIFNFQDAKTYMPGAVRQQNVGLMATWKFSEQSKITFKYFGEDWGQRGEIANANDWGEMVYTPDTIQGREISSDPAPGFGKKSWNGSATWSRRIDRINIGELEFTTPIADKIEARFGAQFQTDHFDQDAAYPSISPSDSAWDASGNVTAVNPGFTSLTAMPVVGQYSNSFWRGFQVQNDYAANFHPGAVSLQTVAGWAFQQGHSLYGKTGQDKNTAPGGANDLPAVNLLANNGQQVVGAGAHPLLSHYIVGFNNTPSFGILKQMYALTKAGFYNDRVYVTGGASRLWVNNTSYALTSSQFVVTGNGFPTPVGPYSRAILDSKKDTYMGGVVLKPTDNSSLYYTFSSNGNVTTSPQADRHPIWQLGKQHEFGFKTEFFDQRLSINADHFQIAQTNLTTPNPLFNIDTTQPPSILTNATSKGYELNVQGGVTKNLSVIASLTSMKYRDAFGRRVRNVPDHLANLLLNYHFSDGALKGASLFVGAVHTGNTAGETVTNFTTAANVAAGNAPSVGILEQPGFYIKGWTVINAGGGYSWSRYRVGVNVDNVLNNQFVWQAAGRNSLPWYPGTTVKVTFNIHL